MQVYTKNKYMDKLTDELIYQNYHKHSIYTNPIITDSCVYPEEYAQRARDFHHGILSSVEHGYGGRAIEYYEMANKYDLKFVYGVEFYFAFDRFEKDNTNAHMVILAKNENGRKAINRILSEANLTGFYHRGRIDFDLVMSLPEDDVWITTACLGGLWKYDNAKINIHEENLDPKLEKFINMNIALEQHLEFDNIPEMLIVKLHEKFKDNFFLEVQAHQTKAQIEVNKKIVALSKKYNIEIIAGTDSHYIFIEDAWKRDYLQKSSGIFMEEESNWFMDYPDGQTLFNRFKRQGVLDDEDIKIALANTNVLLEVEEYTSEIFQKTMKMPSAVKYRNMSLDEKQLELIKIVKQSWETFKNTIPVEQHAYYLREIAKELDTVFKIKHADYFLLNYELIKDAVENRGGMITFSGRGCQYKDALIPTEKELKKIQDIVVGDKVISSDGRLHEVLKTYKYDIDEELIQIIHEYGTNKYNPTIFTVDHKILVHRNNENIWIDAHNVLPTDYVCCPKMKVQEKNYKDFIDLNDYNVFGFDYDDEYIYEYNSNIGISYKYSPTDIATHIGCGKSIIEKVANGEITQFSNRAKWIEKEFFNYVPFDTIKDYQLYIKNIRTTKIRRYINNDYKFNVFLGLLYGDGTHRPIKKTISLALNSVTEKDKINRNIFEEFCKNMGFSIYEYKSSNKDLIQLTFTSKIFSEYMSKEIFDSLKGNNKMLNPILFNQTKENIKGLKYGLWLSDGSNDDGRIGFDNTSSSLVNAYKILSMMCEDCGICTIQLRPAHTDSRGYKSKDSYKLRYPKEPFSTGRGHHEILQDEDFWYLKVKEVKRLPRTETFVYDLMVEGTHDYLSNNMIVHNSGPSFILNNLLGFTHIDRISSPITLYPERFLSTSRMTAGSLADIDFNCGNTPVFEESQRYVMGGEEHAVPMIAYGTQKPKAAWKMYCRAVDVPFEISNQISTKIDEYESDLKYWDEDSGEDEPNVYDYIPEDLREYFDKSKEFLGIINSASKHPCFLGDTLVRTDEGLKEIQAIQINDKVLSHDGHYHEVLQTMQHVSNNIFELKTMASIPIKVTGNHPFLVMSKDGHEWAKCSTKGHYRKTKYTEPYWKNVEDLTSDDRIGIKVLETSIIPSFEGLNEYMNNSDFWWIIGRYMGDGWTEYPKNRDYDDKRIIVCCDKTTDIELNEIISVLNRLNWKYRVDRNKRTAYQIYLYKNSILFDFLQQFGRYANGKHLTQTIIDLPINLLKSFLDGYFSADGSITKRGNSIIQHFGTVSKQLFYDLQTCIHKVYHTHVYIDVEKAHKQIIEGRIVNCKDCYKGTFSLNHIITPTNFYKNGYIWVKIKYINKLDIQDKVYNLSINETNTYNVYNHIVHNCGNILYEGNIKEEFGLIRLKSKGGRETIVACIDGKWCEAYLMLKNDLLTVACVKLNYLLYQRVGIPYMSLNQLLEECRQHSEVWNIYENGYVIGLNQVEKSSTKRKIMKYKPKNISELSALIAGIRPAFKSLIDKLVNREHFEYGIPTLDKLLQTEELPESFILYQEQIMKVLAFAGIPMGDCYTVIKSISKKRFEKIMHYKEQFLTGMSQKLIEAENIDKSRADEVATTIWGIIEDASAYGFNSSHSLSVSFDSLLAAYFKALYPLEFYEVYLNLQMERADKAKAALAKKEAKDAFNIKVLPMRFGQDNRKFTAYPEQNALSNCLKSIKGFGDKIGEEFYKISDRKYGSFLDLLVDIYNIKENKPNKKNYDEAKLSGFAVNDTQMEILIRLNYFEQFGKNAKLLKEFKLFSNIYGRKTLNKEKMPKDVDFDMDILQKYIGKETEAQYRDIDFYGYLKETFEKIDDKFLSLPEQLKFERELFEIPVYENKELPDTWEYILSFKTYGDKINTPYLITYNLNNGNLTVCQVSSSKLFRDNPFGIYSIIDIKDMQHPFKKKKVGEKKWETTNEKKNVVANYEVIIRDEIAEKEREEANG